MIGGGNPPPSQSTTTHRRNLMPMGKGTYGSKRGRPSNKLKGKQNRLPAALKAKIIKSKKRK
tara:strand:+ start:795 stop:980 length:186 start_codon:yes stop_codon:yes gene_type:complete